MGFRVGYEYWCNVDSPTLTRGKYYECLAVFISTYGDAVRIENDDGNECDYYAGAFDESTERPAKGSVAPSPVAAHVAMQAAKPATAAADAMLKKATSSPSCTCGKQAEKRSFSTFEFWYCQSCKKEVGGKAEEKPAEVLTDSSGLAVEISQFDRYIRLAWDPTHPTSRSPTKGYSK